MTSTTYRSPWMTDELDMLRATARRFFEDEVAPKADKFRAQHHIDRDVWIKAGELGLLCMSIPEEYGGQGATFAHEAVMIEEQARICDTTFGFIPGALNSPGFFHGTATHEQLLKWMPDIAAGKKMLCVCITEPDAGTDVKAMRATARREGDEYVLNGNKIFITLGQQADLALVAARTGPVGSGAKGISLFMVETAKTPGFKVNKVLDKIGQNALNTAEIFMEDARVPAENLIGGVEGKGFFQLMDVFQRERLSIGIVGIANAERAIELTIEHAKNRKMLGQTLWDFQNTKFTLAECLTEARIGRVFMDAIIKDLVDGKPLQANDAAMAKWWGSDKQCQIIDRCLQLFGGYGYICEYPIAQMYMDARVAKIYGGSNETLKDLIARTM
ncbi:acyl-CoA dehydrogenase family protein [Variovorax guangxiensis]|uniref:acyl-CoA dehydrogenase family protein n=1 Tax=Variovorax guangxiensis TaxID=1775474 RepID=UPI002854E673|nr:acyl-CoA dehydrogenase family protein [Variovorax guangxiensis]MDR6858584.1 acyl-CoA dehydrogenase [Variovorax guangxiensis]